MAAKRFVKGSEEFIMFMDYWQLCQKFWEPEGNDEYWENSIHETDDFIRKYDSTKFVKGLGIALLDSLEERLRDRKE